MLTVRDVAKMLGVAESTIHRWADSGVLPTHRAADQLRFQRAEVLEWATRRGMNVSSEQFQMAAAPAGGFIAAALRAGGVFADVPGTDRAGVLREVVARLRLPEGSDRDWLFELLLARETMASTALGDGIAIPHVRYPIVLPADQPTVTLCYLKSPVDFAATDGRPVHTLFTLITPSVKSHLHTLAKLAGVLLDADVRAALGRRADERDIVTVIERAETGATP